MSGKHAGAVAATVDAPNGATSPRAEAMEEQDAAEYPPVEDAADLVPEEPPAAVRRAQDRVACLFPGFVLPSFLCFMSYRCPYRYPSSSWWLCFVSHLLMIGHPWCHVFGRVLWVVLFAVE